jgi:hypothetical protein
MTGFSSRATEPLSSVDSLGGGDAADWSAGSLGHSLNVGHGEGLSSLVDRDSAIAFGDGHVGDDCTVVGISMLGVDSVAVEISMIIIDNVVVEIFMISVDDVAVGVCVDCVEIVDGWSGRLDGQDLIDLGGDHRASV